MSAQPDTDELPDCASECACGRTFLTREAKKGHQLTCPERDDLAEVGQ